MALVSVQHVSLDVPDMTKPGVLGKRPLRRIVDDVSFEIEAGETLAIVGESGSGKTSLGRLMVRHYAPSEGRLLFDGHDISHAPPQELKEVRRRMQMIFQDPQSALNPRKTIGAILAQPLSFHGLASDNRAVEALLHEVGLDPALMRRYPHQLSGGQRQRVGIARAIALRPQFVVADEIVSGLDTSTQAQVLRLLKDLQQQLGLAMAFISHDLSVVRHFCERVAILKEGKIIESGKTAEVFAKPRHEFTKVLIEAIPLPEPMPGWLS
jgi:peptide/nickel transport system ATP-binding protein